MLRYKADIKTIIYMAITTSLLILQWKYIGMNPFAYTAYLFFSISVSVITHNHNHVRMWKSDTMNTLQDWWLTVFYGFPVFAWIPTHNKNHHKLNNRLGDYTITYRFSEKNNLLTLLTYPSISGYYQQKAIKLFLKDLWHSKKKRFFLSVAQYVVLVLWIGVALWVDWRKAIYYVIIPQQVSLFSVLIFNYVQHVHANEESEWNHSRNFTGLLNFMLFNNGLHTAHHEIAGLHWSEVPAEHKRIEKNIDPALMERSFWWYIFRNYIMGFFNDKFKTDSMRLKRIEAERLKIEREDMAKSDMHPVAP
jgi:beta-carotene hydroxylase